MTRLLLIGLAVLAASPADARRYVGMTSGFAATVVGRVRWSADGTTLRARFKCKKDAEVCPSAKRGKLLATSTHPGDFGGTLTFKDADCRVAGSLMSMDGVLWETGAPKDAPRMVLQLTCGTAEESFGFIGEQPQ